MQLDLNYLEIEESGYGQIEGLIVWDSGVVGINTFKTKLAVPEIIMFVLLLLQCTLLQLQYDLIWSYH